MRTKTARLIVLIALLAAGCAAQGADDEAFFAEWVTPTAKVTLGEDAEIAIAMGFANQSGQPIPQQDDVAGQWQLVNGEGQVRARGRVLTAGPLKPGETSYPLVWSGNLDSGSYTLTWGAPDIGTVTTELTVFENGGGVGVVRQEISEQFLIDQEGLGEK
jgi:hypothetical protein